MFVQNLTNKDHSFDQRKVKTQSQNIILFLIFNINLNNSFCKLQASIQIEYSIRILYCLTTGLELT